MLKIDKQLVEAINFYKQNPQYSMTKIGDMFSVNRKLIAKYKDYDFSNWVNNLSDEQDTNLYFFTDDDQAIINYCIENQNFTLTDIKNKFPKTCPAKRKTILRWLKIFNIEIKNGYKKKYGYDRNKFSTIQTEEDAYWLGFFTADGCIVGKIYVGINLAARDIDHLKKFCKYMGLTEQETAEIITTGYGGSYNKDNLVNGVKICSKQVIENLQDKGIAHNKSGKEKPYICDTVQLEKAYIRGLLDGDGYIKQDLTGFGLVGSYEICQYVQNFISKNIKDISNNHIREHGIICKLEVSGRIQTEQIIQYFYNDAKIYLTRKYELYKKMNCRV